ncbi:MAG: YfcC family protein, partial [Candidatus Aminicenantes bacterium]|nr:YfcC family protein [Candidatus Aminicenantes bacterium]
MAKRSFKLPHTLVLIYLLVILVYLLALVLPSGEFERAEKTVQGKTRLVTVPGTYHQMEKKWLGPQWLLIAPIRGFQDASLIIFLIFIFGGTFGILTKSGAIDAGIHRLAAFFGRNPRLRVLVIPVLMIIFSLAGSVYGMAEESIPFVLIFIPFAISMGYDSVVGVAIPFVGSAVGFAAAFFNPFTVGIAQGFAELPLYSGLGYRLILWVIATVIAIAFVMIYAEKVRKNPQLSPVYELDRERLLHEGNSAQNQEWGTSQKLIIATLFAGILLLIYGILKKGWYMEEIA